MRVDILLTGGAGYIGSHVCCELLRNGYDTIIVDNLANSDAESIRRVEELTKRKTTLYQADLLDKEAMKNIFRSHRIQAVVHLAGNKAVGESVEHPLMYYHNNVVGTISLLQLMTEFRVKRMVFSSSATVYAPGGDRAIDEGAPLGPANPYGRTKQMIETMLRDLSLADPDWSIVCLRYFNPAGAHPSGRIGENPKGVPNNLFPYMTQVAAGLRDELRIFGADYPTPDGTGVRDYIHVMDLASGHLKAVEYSLRSKGVEFLNLGTGRGYSVLEMVHAFEKATGIRIPYTIVGRRPGDAAVCYANPAKAKDVLGWTASRSLRDMCVDGWRWQSNNPNGYGNEAGPSR